MLETLSNKFKKLYKDNYFLGVLFLCLGLFIYKYQFLSLSYVFDELWVYGPSVREMGLNGPSLLPDALNVNDYRAHPLMFFFLGGLWCSIFGTSVFSTHIFASLISLTLLIVVYFVSKRIFSKVVGFSAVFILVFQSIFISQFSLVLPEILIALLALLLVYFYIKKKQISYFITGCLIVLVKESGVIIVASIVLWNVIISLVTFNRDEFEIKQFLKLNILLSLPIVALLIHFFLLKQYFGWYLFPEHVNEFNFSWEHYGWRIRKTLNYIFIKEGRKPLLVAFIIIAILFNKKISKSYRVFLLLLFFVLIKVFFRYWLKIDFIEIYISPILFIFIIRYIFWDKKIVQNNPKIDFIGFSIVFTILYTLFSSAYFDNLRYLFYVIPFFIIVVCYYVSLFPYYNKIFIFLFLIISISFSLFAIFQEKASGDVSPSYSNVSKLYSKTINYLEDNNYYNHPIKAPFLYKHALSRPLTSYLKTTKIFTDISSNRNLDDCDQCLLVFTSTEPPSPIYKKVKQSPKFQLIHIFKEGRVWSEIYKKKR